MKHRKKHRKLNRNSSHRKAMFSNMCASLIEHEMIKTTVAKAKELRMYIEPLVTASKNDTVARRRNAFDNLRNRDAVSKLFNELGPRFKARPGGYTRVLKCGFRAGDAAPMAIIEFVDRQENAAKAPTPGAEAKSVKKPAGDKPAEVVEGEVV